MKPKTEQEKTAAARQAELLIKALGSAKSSGGYWLNAAGRTAPQVSLDVNAGRGHEAEGRERSVNKAGMSVSPFNSLILSLHSDQNGYKTGAYTTFQSAKQRKEGILAHERGVPFHWYNWSTYVNRVNPKDTITREDYLALPAEKRAQYKGVKNRQIMTVFNIDQTSMPFGNADKYQRLMAQYGRYEDRVHEKTEEKELRQRINRFIHQMKENLVPIRKSSMGMAYYDADKDAVYLPDQKAFEHYTDYVQEVMRSLFSATGHQQRLARESLGGSADAERYECLIRELASGIKMQELGLAARLDSNSLPHVEYWTRELQENPCLIDAIEVDVNAALTVMKKAEQGEKIEYATLRNNRLTREEREKKRPHVNSREAAILVDILAHGGMVIAEANFQTQGAKDAFLEKFGLKNFESEKYAALKMVTSGDPEQVDYAYTQVQSAAANIAQRCSEYLPDQWCEKGHYFISEKISELPGKDTKEFVVVMDRETGIADVILPSCAMSGGHVVLPNGDKRPFYTTPDEVMPEHEREETGAKVLMNELRSFPKDRIKGAIVAAGATYIRFYNKDGALGYYPDDSYFEGKDVFVARLNGKQLETCSQVNIEEAVMMATSTVFSNVQMLRDDAGKWAMYIKPQDDAGYCVYPDKEDLNRFFATIKQGDANICAGIRQKLAEKYHAIAANKPDIKVDLFGYDVTKEDIDRIERVSIFRTKDEKLMCLPVIKGEGKQYPREISQAQWQRLWIAEDMAAYKTALAAKLFADVLHKHEKQEEQKGAAEQKEENKSRLFRQFCDMKSKHPDAILLFRMGEFYECYVQDAQRVSNVLGLTLAKDTGRMDEQGKPLEVAGFPHHALDMYLPKLIRSGARVAICDQLDAPKTITRNAESETKEEATCKGLRL